MSSCILRPSVSAFEKCGRELLAALESLGIVSNERSPFTEDLVDLAERKLAMDVARLMKLEIDMIDGGEVCLQ